MRCEPVLGVGRLLVLQSELILCMSIYVHDTAFLVRWSIAQTSWSHCRIVSNRDPSAATSKVVIVFLNEHQKTIDFSSVGQSVVGEMSHLICLYYVDVSNFCAFFELKIFVKQRSVIIETTTTSRTRGDERKYLCKSLSAFVIFKPVKKWIECHSKWKTR